MEKAACAVEKGYPFQPNVLHVELRANASLKNLCEFFGVVLGSLQRKS
ncbi:MAG: hypothetical protein K6B13_13615 [Prevotella sp.]|nr:hypothetical protein [Prevotella sp.]